MDVQVLRPAATTSVDRFCRQAAVVVAGADGSLETWLLLAVGSMVVLSIHLRRGGQPGVRPVEDPHHETADIG